MSHGRVIFVNRVYWPEESATAQLLQDLATALVERGHRVMVLTAANPNRPASERHDGVEIRRLGGRHQPSRGRWSQAWQYAGFWVRSTLHVLMYAHSQDTVVAMTDPPLLGIGIALAARLRRATVVQWTQDLYPEVAVALARRRSLRLLLRALRPLRDGSWSVSRFVVFPGADMAARVTTGRLRDEQMRVVPNWAPRGLVPAAPEVGDERPGDAAPGRFVVAYSGNLGRVHTFDPLLAAAGWLRERTDIVFRISGRGARRDEVAAAAQTARLENVQLLPAQPRLQLGPALAAADLHVITLRDGCEGTVWPSKFYGILAVGRPILYLGPPGAEVAKLIHRHGLGACFEAHQVAEIARFILRVADRPADRREMQAAVTRYHATLPGLAGALTAWETILALRRPLAPRHPLH